MSTAAPLLEQLKSTDQHHRRCPPCRRWADPQRSVTPQDEIASCSWSMPSHWAQRLEHSRPMPETRQEQASERTDELLQVRPPMRQGEKLLLVLLERRRQADQTLETMRRLHAGSDTMYRVSSDLYEGLGAFVGVGSRGSYRSAIRILDRDRTSANSRQPDILVILIALATR
jgi:hypothetical protein